jgi:membrane associated rhomboid family serine protease
MHIGITIVIIIITCLVSIGGFSNKNMIDDLIFYPPAIRRRQYYRFISHGFIHADIAHLAFNMIALYSFGDPLETVLSFDCVFGKLGPLAYLLLYFTALIVASLPDYFRYRNAHHFRSLGASGAVSAIIFSMLIFFPQTPVGLIFLPLRIPGYIFAIIYLGVTVYLDRKGGSHINHSAHFWGAAYGIVFTLLACKLFANSFDLYTNFMIQLKSSSADFTLICN